MSREKKKEQVEVTGGSGNVFRDLGFKDPEEAQAKADLAREIARLIKLRKLTQAEAGDLMGVDQARVSDIVRGNLSRVTLDRLVRFVRRLGCDVEIRTARHTNKHTQPSLSVMNMSQPKRSPRA